MKDHSVAIFSYWEWSKEIHAYFIPRFFSYDKLELSGCLRSMSFLLSIEFTCIYPVVSFTVHVLSPVSFTDFVVGFDETHVSSSHITIMAFSENLELPIEWEYNLSSDIVLLSLFLRCPNVIENSIIYLKETSNISDNFSTFSIIREITFFDIEYEFPTKYIS